MGYNICFIIFMEIYENQTTSSLIPKSCRILLYLKKLLTLILMICEKWTESTCCVGIEQILWDDNCFYRRIVLIICHFSQRILRLLAGPYWLEILPLYIDEEGIRICETLTLFVSHKMPISVLNSILVRDESKIKSVILYRMRWINQIF